MEQEKLTFNDLPGALEVVLNRLEALGAKVDKLMNSTDKDEESQWLNVAELIKYLPNHPAEQTIYSWTSTRRIPFHKKGRRVLFNKKEIDKWLQDSDYRKSSQDLEEEAMLFVNNKRIHIIKNI